VYSIWQWHSKDEFALLCVCVCVCVCVKFGT
jgi:hypothetical protein